MIITYLPYTVASPAIVSVSPPPGATILPTADTFEVQFDQEVKLFFAVFCKYSRQFAIHFSQNSYETTYFSKNVLVQSIFHQSSNS